MTSPTCSCRIVIGTTSEQKIAVLSKALDDEGVKAEIVPCDVDSGIIDQPLNEEATRQGARNRSHNARIYDPPCDLSIGLEGGLIDNDAGGYDLICIADIQNKEGAHYVGMSARRTLPLSVSREIRGGEQFGQAIRAYFKEERYRADNIKQEDTEELIVRQQSFYEAIQSALKNGSVHYIFAKELTYMHQC